MDSGEMDRMSLPSSCLVLFALASAFLLFAFVPNASSGDDPDLLMEIITEKKVFAVGENVNVTIRLTNTGPDQVLINYTGYPYVFYSVLDAYGNQLYDVMLHSNIILPVGTDTIGPGESKDIVYNGNPDSGLPFMIAWDQTDDGGSQVPAPGYYELVGRFDLVSSPVPVMIESSWILIGSPSQLVAEFTYEPSVVYTDTIVMANASNSRNMADGTEGLTFRWDWENDGIWDTSWSSAPVAYHQYQVSGIYTMKLEVMDLLGYSATADVEIDVTGPDVPEFSGLWVPLAIVIAMFSLLLVRRRNK